MPPKNPMGPLTDEEAQARMNKLVGIITGEAQKEINQVLSQTAEEDGDLGKSLVAEPRQIIDEWVEKLRAYTERQTKIHCARLRRIAKLRTLEAYGDIKENIKNEARERIKDKMSKKTEETDRVLGNMLFQGLLRLMEPKVLVHTTKADLERVSKLYESVTKRYKEMTSQDLKLITSRHPLKDHYYGRIVISDKISSMFVDMNLYVSVDKVADEVFAHYATYEDKAGTSKNWGMEALRIRGLSIMPRGPHLTTADLDRIISTMRGDPRTQVPVFQIKEESKKREDLKEDEDKNKDHRSASGASSLYGHKSRNSSTLGRTRKVTIAPETLMSHGMRPSLSMMEPGGFGPPQYGRRGQDMSEPSLTAATELYNLDFTSSTDLSQHPSKLMGTMTLGNEPVLSAPNPKSTISADKEAPPAARKAQQQKGRSVSESDNMSHESEL